MTGWPIFDVLIGLLGVTLVFVVVMFSAVFIMELSDLLTRWRRGRR